MSASFLPSVSAVAFRINIVLWIFGWFIEVWRTIEADRCRVYLHARTLQSVYAAYSRIPATFKAGCFPRFPLLISIFRSLFVVRVTCYARVIDHDSDGRPPGRSSRPLMLVPILTPGSDISMKLHKPIMGLLRRPATERDMMSILDSAAEKIVVVRAACPRMCRA